MSLLWQRVQIDDKFQKLCHIRGEVFYFPHPSKEMQLTFSNKFNLYYTGFFGKQKAPTTNDWQDKTILITSKGGISSAAEFFQVMEAVPTFQQVQSGFTYYWFKEGCAPSWESCPNSSLLEFKKEENDDFVNDYPEKWTETKCEYEAKVLSLLLMLMGNSNQEAVKQTRGIVIKIRRSRIAIQLWFDGDSTMLLKLFSGFLGCEARWVREMSMKDAEKQSIKSRHPSRANSRDNSRENSRDR